MKSVDVLVHGRSQGTLSTPPHAFRQHAFTAPRLQLQAKLPVHNGCVNTISWSECGRYIVSGSDDRMLCVTDCWAQNEQSAVVHRLQSGHTANIFSAHFMPDTDCNRIVSCANDGSVSVTDVLQPDTHGTQLYCCHEGSVYDLCVIANDSNSLLTVGEDCTVRWFDTRLKLACHACTEDVIVQCDYATCAVRVNELRPWQMAVGCMDSCVRLYDLRAVTKGTFDGNVLRGLVSVCCLPESACKEAGRHRRVTSVDYSPDGSQLLASYSSDDVYVYATQEYTPENKKVDLSEATYPSARKPPPRRIRLRGDWSDTGSTSFPPTNNRVPRPVPDNLEAVANSSTEGGRLLHRLSNVVSRMFERSDERRRNMTQAQTRTSLMDSQMDMTQAQTRTSLMDSQMDMTQAQTRTSLMGSQMDMIQAQTRTSLMENQMDTSDHDQEVGPASERSIQSPDEAAPVVTSALSKMAHEHNLMKTDKTQTNDEEHQGPSTSTNFETRNSAVADTKEALQEPHDLFVENGVRVDGALRERRRQQTRALPQNLLLEHYTGHRNARTMLKQACFWGAHHIISGSDCGHIFVWNRTSKLIELVLEADTRVVNCVQPNPQYIMLATSGIDYDIKLWTPIAQTAFHDTKYIQQLVDRNKKMLEETRDTVTIPAVFMLRMIAQINRSRRGGGGGGTAGGPSSAAE